MRQSSAASPTAYSQRGLGLVGIEVLLQVRDHLVARVAVDAQECVVITDTIETLKDVTSHVRRTKGVRTQRHLLV